MRAPGDGPDEVSDPALHCQSLQAQVVADVFRDLQPREDCVADHVAEQQRHLQDYRERYRVLEQVELYKRLEEQALEDQSLACNASQSEISTECDLRGCLCDVGAQLDDVGQEDVVDFLVDVNGNSFDRLYHLLQVSGVELEHLLTASDYPTNDGVGDLLDSIDHLADCFATDHNHS